MKRGPWLSRTLSYRPKPDTVSKPNSNANRISKSLILPLDAEQYCGSDSPHPSSNRYECAPFVTVNKVTATASLSEFSHVFQNRQTLLRASRKPDERGRASFFILCQELRVKKDACASRVMMEATRGSQSALQLETTSARSRGSRKSEHHRKPRGGGPALNSSSLTSPGTLEATSRLYRSRSACIGDSARVSKRFSLCLLFFHVLLFFQTQAESQPKGEGQDREEW